MTQKKFVQHIEEHNQSYILVSKKNSLGKPINSKIAKKLLISGKYELKVISGPNMIELSNKKEAKEIGRLMGNETGEEFRR